MSPVRYVAEKLNPMHAVGRKMMKEPYIVAIARLKGRVAAVVINCGNNKRPNTQCARPFVVCDTSL